MSDAIKIQVDYDNTEFTPGDSISGTISWLPSEGTESISLRLFWFTRGRGTQDLELIEELSWPVLPSNTSGGTEQFAFTLPNGPYSFSGQLISLTWAIEVVQLPGETSTRYEFTLTPSGREIVLNPVDNPATVGKKSKWFSFNK